MESDREKHRIGQETEVWMMRGENNRKTPFQITESYLNERIHVERKSLAEIGRELGISRERIRQYKERFGIKLPKRSPRCKYGFIDCPVCGKTVPNLSGERKTCSKACYRRLTWPLVQCWQCGKFFEKRASLIRRQAKDSRYVQKNNFCSRGCFGRWFGLNYGFKGKLRNDQKARSQQLSNP